MNWRKDWKVGCKEEGGKTIVYYGLTDKEGLIVGIISGVVIVGFLLSIFCQ